MQAELYAPGFGVGMGVRHGPALDLPCTAESIIAGTAQHHSATEETREIFHWAAQWHLHIVCVWGAGGMATDTVPEYFYVRTVDCNRRHTLIDTLSQLFLPPCGILLNAVGPERRPAVNASTSRSLASTAAGSTAGSQREEGETGELEGGERGKGHPLCCG